MFPDDVPLSMGYSVFLSFSTAELYPNARPEPRAVSILATAPLKLHTVWSLSP